MAVNFSPVWKDCGLVSSLPPLLVVPLEGVALVYLNGVGSFSTGKGMKFDSNNLTVSALESADVLRYLTIYADNFPGSQRAEVLALAGGMQTSMHFGSIVLSVQASVGGVTTALDYSAGGKVVARMDAVGLRRRTLAVSFRFVRYVNDAGVPAAGSVFTPDDAAGLVAVMNRLFMPSANIELTLRSAEYLVIGRRLGATVSEAAFRADIAPRRDRGALCTVFFVGTWAGKSDPFGTAFSDLQSVVVDDAPDKLYRASETAWPPHRVTDEQLENPDGRQPRPASDRSLHILLAHELAHILGADHEDEQDTLMSNKRQDLKLSRATIRAIGRS